MLYFIAFTFESPFIITCGINLYKLISFIVIEINTQVAESLHFYTDTVSDQKFFFGFYIQRMSCGLNGFDQ